MTGHRYISRENELHCEIEIIIESDFIIWIWRGKLVNLPLTCLATVNYPTSMGYIHIRIKDIATKDTYTLMATSSPETLIVKSTENWMDPSV